MNLSCSVWANIKDFLKDRTCWEEMFYYLVDNKILFNMKGFLTFLEPGDNHYNNPHNIISAVWQQPKQESFQTTHNFHQRKRVFINNNSELKKV